MEGRRSGGDGTAYQPIRRGWFYGDKKMKRELLGQMSERLGPEHYGEERRESQGEKAEQIVGKGLQRLKWTEGTLRERNKGDAEKVKIAVQLRKETLVTVAWITELGSTASVEKAYLWAFISVFLIVARRSMASMWGHTQITMRCVTMLSVSLRLEELAPSFRHSPCIPTLTVNGPLSNARS